MNDIDMLEREIQEMRAELAKKETELDNLKLLHATKIYGNVTITEEWSADYLTRDITAHHTGNDIVLINTTILEQLGIAERCGAKFSVGGMDFELVHHLNGYPLWEVRVLHPEN